jgi:hypothetical protein
MNSNSHRGLFLSAAWFNFLAGLPLIVALGIVAPLMGLQINPTATLFIQITASVIVVFGWAYWMIARDPKRFRPYIVLGIVLKIVVVVVVFGHWIAGNILWLLPALAAVDAIYAVLFWRYYRSSQAA